MNVRLTVRILREGDPELDLASCGDTKAEARRNIADAVQGFLETARERGTLKEILVETGRAGQGYPAKRQELDPLSADD